MTKEEQTNLRELVKKDKLGEAIEALLSFEADNKEFIALASRMTAFDKKVNGNTAKGDDLAIERNQIAEVILKYIEQFPLSPKGHSEANLPNSNGQSLLSKEGKRTIVPETIANSIDMKAYEFYFSIRNHLLTFIEASQRWRLGLYQDDQVAAETVNQAMGQLSRLQNHLHINHMEADSLFELTEEAIEMLEIADNELFDLVVGKKTASNGLRLKISNIQKKLTDIVLEIDKKLQIDKASQG